uniref:Peptidyl-prolyl cis-trans isomerase SDCCAG10 n=1 Tax=Aegilops tauschii TaxID=37682 RepID=M8BTI6_AEGTA
MSSVYVLEPPTKGKVVVQTTAGPIDIELWAKEAPKATRNFVQLCLEGYYDGTLFHRVIKSFLIQGGDPTGSGTRGESIYGAPFADEFHSRLRFNHRGLLACANAGTPHSNGSQFFITLDRCDWLDKKNTIFGKVTGDSIFNLLALADIETDKDDRPVYPQKILSVEVLWNPFDDIVPRQLKKIQPAPKADAERKPEKKAVKYVLCMLEPIFFAKIRQLNVLSFGDEVEEEENEAASFVNDKIKSIHDVLDDSRFLKVEPQVEQLTLSILNTIVLVANIQSKEEEEKKNETVLSIREALISKKADSREPEHDPENDDSPEDENEEDFDNRMRSRILKKRRELGDIRQSQSSKKDKSHQKDKELPAHRFYYYVYLIYMFLILIPYAL